MKCTGNKDQASQPNRKYRIAYRTQGLRALRQTGSIGIPLRLGRPCCPAFGPLCPPIQEIEPEKAAQHDQRVNDPEQADKQRSIDPGFSLRRISQRRQAERDKKEIDPEISARVARATFLRCDGKTDFALENNRHQALTKTGKLPNPMTMPRKPVMPRPAYQIVAALTRK